MATPVQRLTSIVEACTDQVSTAGQLTTVADGYVNSVSDAYILAQFGKARADLTNAERALIAVTLIRQGIKTFLKNSNAAKTRADAEASAEASIVAAGDTPAAGL